MSSLSLSQFLKIYISTSKRMRGKKTWGRKIERDLIGRRKERLWEKGCRSTLWPPLVGSFTQGSNTAWQYDQLREQTDRLAIRDGWRERQNRNGDESKQITKEKRNRELRQICCWKFGKVQFYLNSQGWQENAIELCLTSSKRRILQSERDLCVSSLAI